LRHGRAFSAADLAAEVLSPNGGATQERKRNESYYGFHISSPFDPGAGERSRENGSH
jgi:hypothetical protein